MTISLREHPTTNGCFRLQSSVLDKQLMGWCDLMLLVWHTDWEVCWVYPMSKTCFVEILESCNFGLLYEAFINYKTYQLLQYFFWLYGHVLITCHLNVAVTWLQHYSSFIYFGFDR